MKNKLIRTLLTSTILISSIAGATPVLANDVSNEIEKVENEAKEHEAAANSLESLMNNIQNELTNTQAALTHLNNEIQINEQFLQEALRDLEKSQEEMTVLEEEIAILEENIENRSYQLEEQARKVQVDGNSTTYIDFVLTAESLTDVLARIDVVSTVVNASNKLIEDQRKDKEAVVEKTAETERKIVQQNALAEDLEKTTAQLEGQKIAEEALVAQLAMEQTTIESERASLLAKRNDAMQRAEELAQVQATAQLAAVQAEEERQTVSQMRPASSTTVAAPTTNNNTSGPSNTNVSNSNNTNNNSNNATNNNNSNSSNQTPAPAPNPAPEQPKPENKPVPAPNPAPAPSGNVLSIASQYLGTPYLYGGTTPSAFDCSGYTSYVFAQAGKSIPRTSAAQYARSSKISNPQPGDLVFFGSGSVSHVGIYVGGGRFIGSQTNTGVAYASLATGYWSSRVIGYGRY